MKKRSVRLSGKAKKRIIIAAASVLAAAVTYVIGVFMLHIPRGELQVHFINSGQGDSSLLISEDGAVLIDCSTAVAGDGVAAYVKNRTRTLDYLILTHPHEDHIGGATAVLDAVEVKCVIMPDVAADTATFDRLLDSIEKEGCQVIAAEAGNSYSVGELKMSILSPENGNSYEDLNNMSIVLRAEFGVTSFMFTGDAEAQAEENILKGESELRCDVLKVGHHGSSTSSSREFLERVSPKIAVISCGEGNDYGHPHSEVIKRLGEYEVRVFRTDVHGTVVIATNGTEIRIK